MAATTPMSATTIVSSRSVRPARSSTVPSSGASGFRSIGVPEHRGSGASGFRSIGYWLRGARPGPGLVTLPSRHIIRHLPVTSPPRDSLSHSFHGTLTPPPEGRARVALFSWRPSWNFRTRPSSARTAVKTSPTRPKTRNGTQNEALRANPNAAGPAVRSVRRGVQVAVAVVVAAVAADAAAAASARPSKWSALPVESALPCPSSRPEPALSIAATASVSRRTEARNFRRSRARP